MHTILALKSDTNITSFEHRKIIVNQRGSPMHRPSINNDTTLYPSRSHIPCFN